MVSPPFLRLGAGPSGATLERRMPRERPPNQSAHTAIMGSKASEANYTLIQPVALTDKPGTGTWTAYGDGYIGRSEVTRTDLARYLLTLCAGEGASRKPVSFSG